MSNVRENTIRLLFGYDIFISYARADSATYAARLASELTALGFFCRLDQWGSNPGKEVPSELLRALRRSSMLVVVGSSASAASSAVEAEIREFLPTKRFIVPVNIDGAIRSARWWPLLEGLAVAEEPLSSGETPSAPSPETVQRIENTATFTRRTARLRRFAVAALAVFAVLVGLTVVAGKRVVTARRLVAAETARAEAATGKRIESERAAEEQRGLAAAAVLARKQADRQRKEAELLQRQAAKKATHQEELAAIADRNREEAERKLTEELAKLQKTEDSLKQQTAVADSRELARQALALTSNQSRLEQAIRSAETEPTDAAREALADAVRKVIDTRGSGPYAVNTSGDRVAVAGSHGQGVLMDLNSGRTTQLCGSPEPIQLLSFSPDSKYLLAERFDHVTNQQVIWQYELWATTSGVPKNSAQVETPSLNSPRWSPDSSMFLSQGLKDYRVSVESSGRLIVDRTKDDIQYDSKIVFSEDRPLYLKYGTAGLSLSDYTGNKLWSEPMQVEWAAFRNHSSRVVIKRQRKYPHDEFEILELDAGGRPASPSQIVSPMQFDYRMLAGSEPFPDLELTLGESIRAKNPALIGDPSGCRRIAANFAAGLVFCEIYPSEQMTQYILFDVATQTPLGALKAWSFGSTLNVPVFSPDGKMLVVATQRPGLTAWDTATQELRWKRDADAERYEFSMDGKRVVLLNFTGDKPLNVLDAQTGKTIGEFPTRSEALPVWINPTGTRMITAEPVRKGEKGNQTLVLWDVDGSAELRRIELSSADKAEEDRDIESLKRGAGVPVLLEIAHRRLRACDGAMTAKQ